MRVPPRFKLLPDLAAFRGYLRDHPAGRKITTVQIHHTYRPTLAQYLAATDREGVIRGMWEDHVYRRGWNDIGQHFSVAPDGIWTGRPLTADPAGIVGANRGAIMFEGIGDFGGLEFERDKWERLEGAQLGLYAGAVAETLKAYQLGTEAILFHRERAPKTCPGLTLDRAWFVRLVALLISRP